MKSTIKVRFVAISAIVLSSAVLLAFSYKLQKPDEWVVPAKYKSMKNPTKADAESTSVGKTLWAKHCKSCHGKVGKGDGPKAGELDTPSGDFSSAEFQKQSDGSLFYKTKTGREDMPGFEKKIPEDEDRWHLVNIMRSFK